MTNRFLKLKLFLLGLVVMLLTTGCPNEVLPDTRINTDKNRINIQQQGGVDTITMVDNYELWWLSSVYVRRLEFEYVESCQCEMPREVSEERYYFAAKRRGFFLTTRIGMRHPTQPDWIVIGSKCTFLRTFQRNSSYPATRTRGSTKDVY